jgi:hypothetical protein
MRITLAALASAASLVAACPMPASAAERGYTVTDFNKVRVQGPFAVTLVTGVAPFARASGSQRAIDAVTLRVEGRTLIIQANSAAWGGDSRNPAGPIAIAIGTHDLASASLSGSGSLAIDKVRGLDFTLTVVGAGTGSIARADLDRLTLAVAGSGSAKVAGKASRLTAMVRGTASLDAAELAVKDATLTAQGPAIASLNASSSAKIDAAGTASVTVTGSAACSLKIAGSATVSGCRR